MINLTVVIINYRTSGMLIDCLQTLVPELEEGTSRVVVVDNHSNDGSAEIIKKWISDTFNDELVTLICSEKNGGFSAGNNMGVKLVQSKYYLLLNSDTLIRANAILTLLDSAQTSSDVGLITPRLEWMDEKSQISCFNFHSPLSEFINSAQTGLITKIFNNNNVPIPVTDTVTTPDWSSFACVLIKKEVFSDIGLMDNGYFMYFEDAEFCHRAKKAGWRVLNEPKARVVHLRGGSSPVKENTKLKKRLPRYYYESRTRYFYQTYGWFGLTAANLLWNTGRLISKTRQILGRHDKAISEKQWRDIWTNWLNPLKPYVHPDNYK